MCLNRVIIITGKFSVEDIITKGTCRTFAKARGVALPSSQSKNSSVNEVISHVIEMFTVCQIKT